MLDGKSNYLGGINMAENNHKSRKLKNRSGLNRMQRFIKRVLYFKPTTFIGTVVLTAVLTSWVQNLMSKPKAHHKPRQKEAVVQQEELSGTNYVAVCSGCQDTAEVKTQSGNPVTVYCLACQKNFDIVNVVEQDNQISR